MPEINISFNVHQEARRKVGTLRFEGDLSINHVAEVKERLMAAIKETDEVRLKFGDFERVDILFIQLICAAHRECLLTGKRICILNAIPAPIREIMESSGYMKRYGCLEGALDTCVWLRKNFCGEGKDEQDTLGG